MPTLTKSDWDAFLARYPDAHILQTSDWGRLKTDFGWRVHWIRVGACGAQVLLRPLPFGFHLAYIPKGPVGPVEEWDRLWPEIERFCRSQRTFLLLVEPDLWDGEHNYPSPPGFQPAVRPIQPPRTVVVDLGGTEEQILARMKQKTRYNIRLAARKGVQVSSSDDLDAFYDLAQITGERDGFAVHNRAYYARALELFAPRDQCRLLLATHEDVPLAGLMVFQNGRRAWYFYGASSSRQRELMPNYLLQWEAMRWARSQGCWEYDLWG